MLKYSPEENQSLEYLDKDSKKMIELSEKARNILKNINQQSLDDTNQKRVVEEAKIILARSDITQRQIIRETKRILKRESMEEPNESSEFDEASDCYSNVLKNTTDELFFKTISEELPDLGVSLEENKDKLGSFDVKVIPHKTDKLFLGSLEFNHVIEFLRFPWNLESLGKKLEGDKLLASGITERVMKKVYQEELADNKYFLEHNPSKEIVQEIQHCEKQLARFEDITPITNEEIKEIMKNIIKKEYEKELLGNNNDEYEET